MPKSSNTISDAERLRLSEPTKYIVRCCELRKLRQEKAAASAHDTQRIRVRLES